MNQQKKYILKPGKHQFVPGDHAWHDNENLTDAEAKWYLEQYPHIRSLFIDDPEVGKTEGPKGKRPRTKRKIGDISLKSVKSENNEDLSATN